jgi:hypothetical protein
MKKGRKEEFSGRSFQPILVPSKYTVYQPLIDGAKKTNKHEAFEELEEKLKDVPVVNTTRALQQAAAEGLEHGACCTGATTLTGTPRVCAWLPSNFRLNTRQASPEQQVPRVAKVHALRNTIIGIESFALTVSSKSRSLSLSC